MQQAAAPKPAAPVSPSPAACRLPVYWSENNPLSTRAAFIDLVSGTVAEVGSFPRVIQYQIGATYDPHSHRWQPIERRNLSPDLDRYAYEAGVSDGQYEIHVVDIASGADRIAYSGSTYYIVLAFESDAIYLVHGVNPRQGSFRNLYRLNPGGGAPALVKGSDRHMYQYGWTRISGGAAWGLDYRIEGSVFTFTDLGPGSPAAEASGCTRTL